MMELYVLKCNGLQVWPTKKLILHDILSVYAFPRNQTHDLGIASTMLYCLIYRKHTFLNLFFQISKS